MILTSWAQRLNWIWGQSKRFQRQSTEHMTTFSVPLIYPVTLLAVFDSSGHFWIVPIYGWNITSTIDQGLQSSFLHSVTLRFYWVEWLTLKCCFPCRFSWSRKHLSKLSSIFLSIWIFFCCSWNQDGGGGRYCCEQNRAHGILADDLENALYYAPCLISWNWRASVWLWHW